MTEFVLDDNNVSDLTSQITELPIAYGSSDNVHRCTIQTNKGIMEVAVRKFENNMQSLEVVKRMRRELKVWLRLKHPTIVPLLGVAFLDPQAPLPALVSQWMPSGTLYIYMEKQATILTAPAKVALVKGIADGLSYLHSENVIHGDLHPGNVLIDGSGNPRLTDFGLATVAGDTELQWSTTTVGLDNRWRAPEIIGIECNPGGPTFKSDIYSFGSVMFFITSGDIPWKGKQAPQVHTELSKGVFLARPDSILDNHWNLIQICWSWNPEDRPGCAEVLKCMNHFRTDDSQAYSPKLPPDLTGQIFGTINDFVAGGSFGNVYRCEWRQSTGPIKVAVKVVRSHKSEEDLRKFQREAVIWACLLHEHIVTLFGTTGGFGPSPALVSPWFPHGTLLRLISERGARLSIWSRLNLLHDIASGLSYLHSFPIIHGDISSSNVMVDVEAGRYKARLTDFGLATVLGGLSDRLAIEKPFVRHGAIRWTAPELLKSYDRPAEIKPTTQNDMYSFGRVMFHVLTLVSPWSDIDDYEVLRRILSGKEVRRPRRSSATPDITDTRWNEIKLCWSIDAPTRPSALMAMTFLKSELRALTDDDVLVGEAHEHLPHATYKLPLSSNAISLHSTATASSLSLSRPFNVLIFGETGVGKSSVINLIMGQDVTQTSPDELTCTLDHTFYEISLNNYRFKLWEVSSIAPMNYFRRLFAKWRLKRSYEKLYKDDGVYLLLYCMRNSRAQGTLVRDYKFFTSIVGSTASHVPIAAVVTHLEDYPDDMDDWWKRNEQNLQRQGMHFSKHACITSLPDDQDASPALRMRRRRSKQVIHSLICDVYQAGRAPLGLNSVPTS